MKLYQEKFIHSVCESAHWLTRVHYFQYQKVYMKDTTVCAHVEYESTLVVTAALLKQGRCLNEPG